MSGSRVETLSSRPSASRAWSNLLRNPCIQSIGEKPLLALDEQEGRLRGKNWGISH